MGNQTALVSVFEKEGIVDFAQRLSALGWTLLASGGTARHLLAAGVQVRDVAEIIKGKPILGHRVVTLSREVHAALMARDTPEDHSELEVLRVPRIDLVCVDLYPLEREIDRPESTLESVIEMTDVGGPTLLHAAAKGQRIVISDRADRASAIKWLTSGKPNESITVERLAAKAELVVAQYIALSGLYRGCQKDRSCVTAIGRALTQIGDPFRGSAGS